MKDIKKVTSHLCFHKLHLRKILTEGLSIHDEDALELFRKNQCDEVEVMPVGGSRPCRFVF